jgi:hypothetical protein
MTDCGKRVTFGFWNSISSVDFFSVLVPARPHTVLFAVCLDVIYNNKILVNEGVTTFLTHERELRPD